MAGKVKEYQECTKCGEKKQLDKDFYISYSPLHQATNRVNICKMCLSEYDHNNLNEILSVLRAIDKPYYEDMWNTALAKEKNNVLSKYIRMLSLNCSRDTWANSDGIANETKSITRMNTEILRKQEELKELEEKVNSIKKDEERANVSKDIISKWGRGYTRDEYEMFEEKYKLIEESYPLRSTMHLEALKTYVRYSVKAELSTANNDIASAKEWGKLANEASKKAKIDPSQLSQQDLTSGIDNFSSLVMAVEKAVDIIPLIPKYIEKGQDKADMMILFYVNYERSLRGLPEVTHAEVYDFYNKMIESYIENNPEDYAFLKDTDENLPL